MVDFATVWQTADKIVCSMTVHPVSTANTRLESRFDPDGNVIPEGALDVNVSAKRSPSVVGG